MINQTRRNPNPSDANLSHTYCQHLIRPDKLTCHRHRSIPNDLFEDKFDRLLDTGKIKESLFSLEMHNDISNISYTSYKIRKNSLSKCLMIQITLNDKY